MSRHSSIRKLLYDYARNDLLPGDRSCVEAHLARCKACSDFLHELSRTLSLLNTGPDPDRQRPQAYWNAFPDLVEARITQRERRPTLAAALQDALNVLIRPRAIATACGAAALVVLGFFLWQRLASVEAERQPERYAQQTAPENPPPARMDRYLQRSKILLVGINNMPEDKKMPLDVSAERRASRELLHEARALKHQPLDLRSVRLLDDLEKIQITVANMNAHDPRPELERVRDGIRQENLLFKVRMAEALYRQDVPPAGPQ